MNVFDLFAKISLDTRGYEASLRDAKGMASGIGDVFGKVAGVAGDALKSAGGIGNARIDSRRKEESCHGETERLFVNPRRTNGNRQGGNQARVADNRTDCIPVGNAAVMLEGSLRGDHDLRQGRANGNDRCSDEKFRHMKAVCNTDCSVNKPVPSLDQADKTDKEQ